MRDHGIYSVVVFRYVEFLWDHFLKGYFCDLLPVWEISTRIKEDELRFVFLNKCMEFADASGLVCGEIFLAST